MSAGMLKARQLVVARYQRCCARCGRPVTGRYSLHHRKPRRMGGSRDEVTHSAANQVLLDGSGTEGCHGYVESFRDEARALGWLLHDGDSPLEVPLLHAIYGWVLLDVKGGWEPTDCRPS